MSKEYNLAGKNLVVDGITILGNRKKQRSSVLTQAITNGELARDNALTGEQVEALGGTVVIISEDLTETKGRVTTNENNISGLDGRMGTAEGSISSQGLRLTDAEGTIIAQGLRLTTAEGDITSQGTRIGTAEENIESLDGRLDTAEGDITSQGTRLSTAEGTITSQGVRITDAEGNIVAQGLRITDAEGNITAQGLRLTDAEGNIVAQGLRLTTAEGDISAQGLRLTAAEGDISAQGIRLTDAEGNILAQGLRITDNEGKILNLQLVTKRFDVRSKQTSVIRNDAEIGFQIINLQSTIVGYDNPQPRLAILASVENFYRICAFDNSPSTSTLEDLVEGTSVNPTPSDEGDWYRGGLQFVVGEKAAYVVNDNGEYRTAILTITSVSDTSVTGTIDTGGLLLDTVVGVDDRDMTNVSLYIPYRRAGKIEATLYNDNTQMDRLTLPVSNITRRWKEIPAVDRFGDLPSTETVTEGSTTTTKYLIDGDCCVVRYTGSPEAFTATTYIYKNNDWVPASEEAQFSDAQQIIQTVYSVVKEAKQYKTDNPDFSYEDLYVGTTGVFEVLKVGLVYAAKIFAEEILSANWEGRDQEGYPIKGFRLSTAEDLIEAVSAVLKGAKIRESDLYDVSVSSLDTDDGQGNRPILFKTNKRISAPSTNPMTFDNEADGYYVESAIRTLTWVAGQNDNVTMTYYSGYRRFVGSTNKNQSFDFTVQNACNLFIRAPYWNRTILWGTPGTMSMSIHRTRSGTRTEIFYGSGVAYNTTLGDFFDFQRGDYVEVDITFVEGNDGGITTTTEGSLVVVMFYYDILEQEQGGGGTTAKGMLIDHYGKTSTISWTAGNDSGTFDLFFPIMEHMENYRATRLAGANVLVDGASATSKASMTTAANKYNAVAPFLNAKATQGSDQVDAFPRGAVITFQQTTVYYKRDPYTVNQLLLTENYVQFMYNEQVQFSVNTSERSTLKYSLTLIPIDPSLTVTDLIPVDGTTDLGKTGSNGAFNNGYINTIKTKVIQPQYGETLDIQADTISGDLTGDVTGNVNSAGTSKVVYGAVFN